MEYPCSSPTQERWFVMTAVPMHSTAYGAVITHTNVTRRRQAEKKLRESEQYLRTSREEYRALARELLMVREGTRRHLARELHDSFSQRLALISMLAAKMELERNDLESLKAGLKQIQDETARLSGDVHDIARQLHPQILEDLGLETAVEAFCTSISKNEGLPITFNRGEIPADIPLNTGLNLYRIIQESLGNAVKHANARRVTVGLEIRDSVLRLSIRDDGIGFDLSEARKKNRFGLISIRERAAIIGGSLEISSAPGSGTEISVDVPLGDE
jgi:two-component system sensor histidine kinase UhpB